MGINLPTVKLGTGVTPTGVVAGEEYSCVILDGGNLKCWGYNTNGQLGLGDTDHRGDEPDEMGDLLPFIVL